MRSRLLRPLVYLLLALLPLQGIAAANMLVCNSLMQQAHATQAQKAMPCHQTAETDHMTAHQAMAADEVTHAQPVSSQHSGHPSCGMLCNSLCGMTALPAMNLDLIAASKPVLAAPLSVSYYSITLPLLQRPPISFA